MELTLFDGHDYVGSVNTKAKEPPMAVCFAGQAYVSVMLIGHIGARAGGVPRYMKVDTLSVNEITTTVTGREHLRAPRKRKRG
jgi:hypothetical protein